METKNTTRKRLDELLLQRGLCNSRTEARNLILEGKIKSGSTVLKKPGKPYPYNIDLVVNDPPRYVGRGGEKLAGFLDKNPVTVKGQFVLDVGASIGGFTDCLLERGAQAVTCIDVGHDQLHQKLRENPQVTNLEKINVRDLSPKILPHPLYDLVVVDLSFISLRKVLRAIWPIVKTRGTLIILIKPQFEAGVKVVRSVKGIIKDPLIHQQVVEKMREFCKQTLEGSKEIGLMESPILGADGNREFFLALRKQTI